MQLHVRARHQERPSRPSELFYNFYNLAVGGIRQLSNETYFAGPPHSRILLVSFRNALKQNFCYLLFARWQFIVRLVCVKRQSLAYLTNGIVMADVEGFGGLMIGNPVIPRTHEGMLKNRQLVLVVSDIVQQSFYQSLWNPATSHCHGPFDGHPLLFPRHLGHQVIAVVDHLRQTRKRRAITDEIRPHVEGDVDRHLFLMNGGQNEVDIHGRLAGIFLIFSILEVEQFFKLINKKKDIFPGLCLQEFGNLNQSLRAASQDRTKNGAMNCPVLFFNPALLNKGIDNGVGQIINRRIAGADRDDLPIRSRLGHEAAIKNRDQAAIHQTRLPAAGIAHHGDWTELRKLK